MEKNKYIKKNPPSAMITTTVQINPKLYDLCKKNNIRFVESMKEGILLKLSENGINLENNIVVNTSINEEQENEEQENEEPC